MHRIFTTSVASVYPHYVTKAERTGRTRAEVDQVITWLTGFDQATLNPDATKVTGVVCGVRVEDVEDPLMQKIRYPDKLVDELARGRAMEKVLRS